MPVDLLAQVSHQQRSDRRADIDAHVEDRKAGILLHTAVRVKLADHHADIGLEQTGAQNDQQQSEEESMHTGNSQSELSGNDEQSADKHGVAGADQTIRDPAARQRCQIDRCRVETIDGCRGLVIHPQTAVLHQRSQEQNENTSHAVITETLPHLCKEQSAEPFGVTVQTKHPALEYKAERTLFQSAIFRRNNIIEGKGKKTFYGVSHTVNV